MKVVKVVVYACTKDESHEFEDVGGELVNPKCPKCGADMEKTGEYEE